MANIKQKAGLRRREADGINPGSPVDPVSPVTAIEIFEGTAFGDTLRSNDRGHTLMGGDGNDMLQGRAGDDGLFGGNGADIFIFEGWAGHDIIHDFETGIDQMLFMDDQVDSLDDLSFLVVDAGGDAELADVRIEGTGGTWSVTVLDIVTSADNTDYLQDIEILQGLAL